MTRPKRINLPCALYHVFSRTNSGEDCFVDHRDQNRFLKYLEKYSVLFSFRIHAWCLMPNHFHILMESLDNPALSELMRRLLTAYTVYYNKRHDRHGHLFQGRFQSRLVEKSSYLLALSRYIHLNPPRPETWYGSSMKFYINGNEPPFLCTQETLSWFSGNRKKYRKFIKEGLTEKNKPHILRQKYIGGANFVKRTEKRLKQMRQTGSRANRSVNIVHERLEQKAQKKADQLLQRVGEFLLTSPESIKNGRRNRSKNGKARTLLIQLISDQIPWTQQRIAQFMGVKEKSVISYHLRKIKDNPEMAQLYNDLRSFLDQKPV